MLLTAFIIGLAGSFHCVGMCSPLVLAVTSFNSSAFLNRVIYNAGRVFIYGVLGAIVAATGSSLSLFKFQNALSIGFGVLLLAIGIFGMSRLRFPTLSRTVNRFTSAIKNQFTYFIQRKSYASILFMGALNGLLPCGLTMVALANCLIVPSAMDGFYFMLAFGTGTLVVMLGLVSLFQQLVQKFRINFSRVVTVMLIVSGVTLIARGALPASHSQTTKDVNTNDIVICK